MIWPLSALVGLIHVFPDLFFALSLGTRFQGIGLWAATDETLYLTRVSRVMAEQWICSNPMIFEHRHDPWLYPPLGELIEGATGRWLGWSLTSVDWLFTFLFPALFCWLSYAFFRRLLRSRPMAYLGALALSLGYYLIARDSPLWRLQLINLDEALPLQLVRPISQQAHYPFFILALFALYLAWRSPSIRRGVTAGVCLGLTFYLSHFYWTYVFAGVAMLIGFSALKRDWARFRVLMVSIVVGLIVGIPFVINAVQLLRHPGYPDLAIRLGPTYGHLPSLPWAQVAVTVLFFLQIRRLPPAAQFIGAFLIGGWLCLNVQVVSGVTVQSFHWETFTNKTGLIMALCLLADHWWGRIRWRHPAQPRVVGRLIWTGLVALLFTHAILLQWRYYQSHHGQFARLQSLARPFQWLKQHAQGDAVILTNPIEFRRAEYLTAYTHLYTYISEPHMILAPVPQRELEERYLGALAVFNVSDEEASQFIRKKNGGMFLGLYGIPYYGGADPATIEPYLGELEARYRSARQRPSSLLGTYKLDYLLATSGEWLNIPHEIHQHLEETYRDDGYVIARVHR